MHNGDSERVRVDLHLEIEDNLLKLLSRHCTTPDFSTLYTQLITIERKIDTMDANVKALQDKVNADNELIRGNLSNVAADIANLNQKIQDLIANGSLSAEDLAALKEIGDASSAMVTDSANLAALVPDVVEAKKT